MAQKKITAKPNPRTGSYTIHVPKDTRTGTFTSRSEAAAKAAPRDKQPENSSR